MQFKSSDKSTALQDFNLLTDAQKDKMRLSTVRLTNGNFTGSGVLVKDGDSVSILTAKHNLTINQGIDTPVTWIETDAINYGNDFLTNLTVGYNAAAIDGNPQSSQNLSMSTADVEFRQGWGSWDYDLIMISLKGTSDLKTWALANASRYITDNRNERFYLSTKNYLNKPVFILGYGNILNERGVQTSLSHPLQVRKANTIAFNDEVERKSSPKRDFINVVMASASNNTSTAPGDSGGPMFIVGQDRQVYLLGCTLGSNFEPDEMPDDDPIINNASSFIYYRNTLFWNSEAS